ncbi:MAG: hypothetical protein KDD38_05900 [Bdellovibrionales bacterium]|nr:hypothetical protein [Bdellovibrionales bacterium]
MANTYDLKSFLKRAVVGIALAFFTAAAPVGVQAGTLSKIANSNTARAISFGCALLLTGAHVTRAVHAMQDPVKTPFKFGLFSPSQSRRGMIEALLLKAISTKNDSGYNIGGSEIVIEERVGDRLSGYIFAGGIMGYFMALTTTDGHTSYSVYKLDSDEVIQSGELN